MLKIKELEQMYLIILKIMINPSGGIGRHKGLKSLIEDCAGSIRPEFQL